jgi:hypothetical protein
MVGPLACTRLSALPEQEDEVSAVTARVTMAAQIGLHCTHAHLIFETFSFCLIVSSSVLLSITKENLELAYPLGSIAGLLDKRRFYGTFPLRLLKPVSDEPDAERLIPKASVEFADLRRERY